MPQNKNMFCFFDSFPVKIQLLTGPTQEGEGTFVGAG
jgi:hypothetical protein